MEIKACRRCNKMFQYLGGRMICPKCKKEEEEIFQHVKTFLRENVGSTMEEISEATGASLGMIQGFLREGRLEVTPDSPIAISCEQCGVKIRTGRFCDKCKGQLSSALQGAANSLRPIQRDTREKERMRFLNSIDK